MKSKKDSPIHLKQQQCEKLAEIGAYLQQHRLEQSISLDELSLSSRIRKSLLIAVEEGKLEQLPEPIYIRGLIRQIAESLGVNGNELAEKFPVQPNLSFQNERRWWLSLPIARLRPIHLYLIYILIVIGAVNSFSYVIKRSALQASGSIKTQQPSISQPLGENQETSLNVSKVIETVDETMTLQSQNDEEKVMVEIKVKSPSWVKIVADGKITFEGTLPQGSKRTWVATQQLTVRAGNAGGVIVAVNNQQEKRLGDPGQVQEVTYRASSRL
ncbi:MAG: helix-turn-helix domain-containing protein [Chroococcales cyanobacterium]